MEIQQTGQSRVVKGRILIVARFLDANTGRTLAIKLLVMFITAAMVFVPSFVLRGEVLANHITNNTEFIYITDPLFNPGVAWSGLANADPSLIIFLQFFPVLIGLLVIVWLKRWWTIFPVCLFVFGGACNFIDRFVVESYTSAGANAPTYYYNSVVDYLQFEGRNEKFNLPDAFIILGAGLAVIALLFSTLIGMFRRTPAKIVPVIQEPEVKQASAPVRTKQG